jgi:VWFA-related protein
MGLRLLAAFADDNDIPFCYYVHFSGKMPMCNWVCRLLLLLFLAQSFWAHGLVLGLSTPGGSEASTNFTYRSTASEVRLVFFATDEHNRPVGALQKDDFAVVDDERVIRDFRSFTRSDLVKLDVVVLIDSSESTLPNFQQETADVQQLISQWPGSPDDNVSVVSFGGKGTRFVCAGDCRSSYTADQLASVAKGGATPLFDAVEIATDFLIRRRQPDVWPIIILFSDGEDTISKATLRGTLEKILASEAQMYAIDVSRPGPPSNGAATLQRMADDSGGGYARISEGAVRIVSDVIKNLHSARVVTYAPPASSSDFRSIRILPTHNLKLQFRCRRGYYQHLDSAQ